MFYKESEPVVSHEEQIAATIAHEIRNPLALIKANLQYVELCDSNDTNKKNYDVIYRELDRISDILYCYMETDKPRRLALKRFRISDIVRELEQIFKQPLEHSSIRLEISVMDEDIEVKADYNKIKQVLINIVQNAKEAIEAVERKSGLIEIAILKKEGAALICIKDNGKGLSDEDIKRVGTPFFTKKEKGCGLGISVSKEIMRLHKGALEIRGTENVGAEVLISLPLCVKRS